MKKLFVIWFLTTALGASAQTSDSVTHTFFLIGDCGEHYLDDDPMGKVLKSYMTDAGRNATLIYLGDNIYPKGMPEVGHRLRRDAEMVMQYQIEWLPATGASAIFLPGNHDWEHWGKFGRGYMRNQQEWIDSLQSDYVKLLPRDGCPGPVEVKIDSNATLVILDSQWPLHKWDKPSRECSSQTTEQLLAALGNIFRNNTGKRVIIAAHHPLITYGEHGGEFTLRSHLFPLTKLSKGLYIPLPVIGSLYVLYRKFLGHNQDTQHKVYRRFAQSILTMMSQYPGSVYAAGHEHALQHIIKDQSHVIVSGAGAKTEFVRKKRYARFADDIRGFAILQVLNSGALNLIFIQAEKEYPNGHEVYRATLPNTTSR